MDDFEDEDNCDDNSTNNQITICGIGFEKLKTKMTDVCGDRKVNYISWCY